jgi:hypothetical protein
MNVVLIFTAFMSCLPSGVCRYAGIVKKLGWATPIKRVAVHLTHSQRNMLDVFPNSTQEDEEADGDAHDHRPRNTL